MDVLICASRNRLFARALEAMAEAFRKQDCPVRWSPELTGAAGAPKVLVFCEEHSVAAAWRAARGARLFQICLTAGGGVGGLFRRVGRAVQVMRVPLVPPRGLSGPADGLALPALAGVQDGAPVWMHAMPKDLPTAIVVPQGATVPEAVWSARGAFNMVCLSAPMPERQASNVYFKEAGVLPHVLPMAQLALIEEDAALAWQMLGQGVPVAFVTEDPQSDFSALLKRRGLGVVTGRADAGAALDWLARSPGFAANAQVFARTVAQAASADIWVGRLLTRAVPAADGVFDGAVLAKTG